MQEASLNRLVEQAVAANEGFASQHGVTLRIEPGAEAMVRVDPDRLTQVLTNLISNAVKFSGTGAEVVVAMQGRGTQARVEVRDRGPGIPEEFRPRIFGKFSQADGSDTRAKGGSGLGLNISRSLVENMGGTIGFASRVGHGSTFHFELPSLNNLRKAA
jgi:signal transduction histidine kinase